MKETLCYLASELNLLVGIHSELLFSFMCFMTKLYILGDLNTSLDKSLLNVKSLLHSHLGFNNIASYIEH